MYVSMGGREFIHAVLTTGLPHFEQMHLSTAGSESVHGALCCCGSKKSLIGGPLYNTHRIGQYVVIQYVCT